MTQKILDNSDPLIRTLLNIMVLNLKRTNEKYLIEADVSEALARDLEAAVNYVRS